MASGYSYVLSEPVSEFAFRLSASEQKRLTLACRLLASSPDQVGLYPTRDETNRVLQNILIDNWAITFWTDHAVKEVRIVEVVQV
jgi:hypothetical protein